MEYIFNFNSFHIFAKTHIDGCWHWCFGGKRKQKSIKENQTKLPLEKERYSKRDKEYQVVKPRLSHQRQYIRNEIIAKSVKYNQLMEDENHRLKELHHSKSQINIMDKNIQTLRESDKICTEIINLYNNFTETNKKYIDSINEQYRKLWSNFESKWMEWNVKEIVIWFKYKTMDLDTDKVDWNKIEEMMKTRNVSGKSLNKFNDLLFYFVFEDSQIVNHLSPEIEILKDNKYNNNKSKAMGEDPKAPDLFICPISKKIMQDPVIAFDGYSYERKVIESYLKITSKSPITGENADYIMVFPNHILKAQIQKYIKDNEVNI